jgi:hypothetical protein
VSTVPTYDIGVFENLVALLPPLGVGFLFYIVVRAIIHADRRERAALARMEREESEAAEARGEGPAS